MRLRAEAGEAQGEKGDHADSWVPRRVRAWLLVDSHMAVCWSSGLEARQRPAPLINVSIVTTPSIGVGLFDCVD